MSSENQKSNPETFKMYVKFLKNHYTAKKQKTKFENKMKGKTTMGAVINEFSNDLFVKFSTDLTSNIKKIKEPEKINNSLISQSKNELVRTCIRQGNEDKIKKLIPEYDDNDELKDIVNNFKDINKKNDGDNKIKRGPYKEKQKKEYFFITLCPFNNNIKDLINIMNRLLKRNHYFDFCSYVFEQRGDNNNNLGEGGHIHILCNKHIEKANMLKQLLSSIHKFCNKESIDVKIVPECDRNKVELYMQGHKTPDKMDKVRMDIIWRNNNNVKDNICCVDDKTILKPLIFKEVDSECKIFFIGDYKYIQVVIDGEKKLLKID